MTPRPINIQRISISAVGRQRRAVTMIEVISAMAVLGTLVVVSAELLTLARAQRRAVVQRHVALIEAQNALERLTATSSGTAQLEEQLSQLTLAPHAAQLLSDGQITAHAEESAAPADSEQTDETDTDPDTEGYQLTVEVTWRLVSGQSAAPVRLTTWVFPSPALATTETDAEVDP